MSDVLVFMRKEGTAMKSGEIAEKMGIDKKIVDKEIKKLKTEGKIDSPKRCFYRAK